LVLGIVGSMALLGERRSSASVPEESSHELCFSGLSAQGTTGLLDMPWASPGCAWRLRGGFFGSGFAERNYVLVGDQFRQFGGGISVAGTLGRYVEAGFSLAMALGKAEVGEATAALPTLFSMGSADLQLKLHAPWGNWAHVALLSSLRVPGNSQDLVPAPLHVDASVFALGSLSAAKAWPRLPLTFHGLFGYVHDRSLRTLDTQDCLGGTVTECLEARLYSTAAYNVSLPRLRVGIGLSLPIRLPKSFAVVPMAAYRAELVTGDPDPVLSALLRVQFASAPIDGRFSQSLTLGGRLVLGVALSLDVGVRVALQHAGYAMGVKLPTVMGFGALTWELDLIRPNRPQAAQVEAVANIRPKAEPSCRVAGVLVDDASGEALPDAIVRFVGLRHNALLSDAEGRFASGELPCGPVWVEGSRGDRLTARVSSVLSPVSGNNVELRLARKERAKTGALWLSIRGSDGSAQHVRATLYKSGQEVALSAVENGFFARVPVGVWHVRVEASGFLSQERMVAISDGELRLSVTLRRRGLVPKVGLTEHELHLTEPISFVGNTAALSPESQRLLEEVADALIHHQEIGLLVVEHLGDFALSSETLLEERAIAVRNHLVGQGIAPERVVAHVLQGPPRTPPKFLLKTP